MLNIDIEKLATYQIGMEKGLRQGVHRQALETAQKLLAINMEVSQIASITGLPQSEIESLRGIKGG